MRRFIVWLFTCVLLAACTGLLSLDTTVALPGQERWNATVYVKLPALAGNLLGSGSEVLHSVNEQMQQLGVKAQVSGPAKDRNGNLIYTLRASGQGYDQLNLFFATFNSASAFTVDPEHPGRVHFYLETTAIDVISSSVTLRAGRIISSNGRQVNPWTVTWQNVNTPMEAVLQEGNGLISTLLIAGGLLVLLAGLGLALKLRNRRALHRQNVRSGWGFVAGSPTCASCHRLLPKTALVCPYCGKRRRT